MFRDRIKVSGVITATVLGPDGKPKLREHKSARLLLKIILQAKWRIEEIRRMFNYEVSINHNVVTHQGDALIADLMATVPTRTKVDNANGVISVGTGWTGVNPKDNTGVNTVTGSPQAMEVTYPIQKAAWGLANDNVVQYRVIFGAGSLNAAGIDEASLGNGTDNLAYGQVTPDATVGSSDTLQIDWEITFLGA